MSELPTTWIVSRRGMQDASAAEECGHKISSNETLVMLASDVKAMLASRPPLVAITPELREAKSQAEQMRDPVYVLNFIANAKRFDRFHFENDTAFADWAQSLARHALSRAQGAEGEKEGM